ncbi:MAG TPA: diguanylate cyclase [Thiotrichales bacterium]|nr:diguanylate cyclase [Thiotrichales bacterium]
MLAGLSADPGGALVFNQVRSLLADLETEQHRREKYYLALLGVVVDALASSLPAGSTGQLELRLLLQRLAPPLSESDFQALRYLLDRWRKVQESLPEAQVEALRGVIRPLLEGLGFEPAERGKAPEGMDYTGEFSVEAASAVMASSAALDAATPPDSTIDQEIDELVASTELPLPSSTARDDFGALQKQINDELQRLMRQHREFGVMLEVMDANLRVLDTQEGVEEARRLMLDELAKHMEEQEELGRELEHTARALEAISEDSRRLNDELYRVRQLSLTDELTGLPNRRAFLRRLEDEVSRVDRYGSRLGLVILDLDHFKRINDIYGHAAGDQVLRRFSRELAALFRHHDLVARYGGEEFAVVMPNTSPQGAENALAKIRERCQEMVVEFDNKAIRMPTFSAGVVEFHAGESLEQLIARADAALYKAKGAGRNCIIVGESLTA